MRKLKLYGILLLLLSSCSEAAPEISRASLFLTYYGGNGIRERFSFFVLAADDDGIEDLEALYLYHDRDELYWKLEASDWVSEEIDGETWIGSRSIAMVDNGPLPRGQFRAVLADKGGSRAERAFAFDAPAESRHAFPSFSVAGGTYRVVSTYPDNRLLCYDESGAYLATIKLNVSHESAGGEGEGTPSGVPQGISEGRIGDLGLPPEARLASLWALDEEYRSSAVTGTAAVRN